jgi:hypothetical protein
MFAIEATSVSQTGVRPSCTGSMKAIVAQNAVPAGEM